jgi:antitoxin VapB
MSLKVAKFFTNGRSRAVRIPKEMVYSEDEEVFITKHDDIVMMVPRSKLLDAVKGGIEEMPDDFMENWDPKSRTFSS